MRVYSIDEECVDGYDNSGDDDGDGVECCKGYALVHCVGVLQGDVV